MPRGKSGRVAGCGRRRRVNKEARDEATSLVVLNDEQVERTALVLISRSGQEYGCVDDFCRVVLPNIPLERARLIMKALAMVASGSKWASVLAATGMSHSDVSCFAHNNKVYREVYKAAKAMQMESMAARTLDAYFDIATEGDEIPVVAGGVVVERRRVRSVKAMEGILAAGDERFARKGAGGVLANGPTFVFPVMPTMTAADVRRGREETEGVVVEGASVVEGSPAPEGGGAAGLLSGLEPEDVEEVEP